MRGVLFDFGGTLNTDGDHWGGIFRQRFGDLFPDATVEEIEEAYVQSERALVRDGLRDETFRETLHMQVGAQFAARGEASETGRAAETAEALYADVVERMKEVRAFLSDLAARYRVGIVSNFYGNLDAVCREFDLTPFLSVMVDSSLVGIRKPDPEIWRIGIRGLNMEPGEVAVVGDSWKNDIGPGAELGCTTIWYRGIEWRPASADQTADHVIHSLTELRSILLA